MREGFFTLSIIAFTIESGDNRRETCIDQILSLQLRRSGKVAAFSSFVELLNNSTRPARTSCIFMAYMIRFANELPKKNTKTIILA